MPKNLTQLKMFISNTSELDHIRGLVDIDINYINKDLEMFSGITIRTIDWRRDVAPGIANYPQQVINSQIEDSDIYLGLLGTHFGTPTPRYGSGTEEELNVAYQKFRFNPTSIRILFYFSKESNINNKDIDPNQLKRVNDFKVHLGKEKGVLYQEFDSPEDFLSRFRNHLKKLVSQEWTGPSWKPVTGLEPSSPDKINNLVKSEPSIEGIGEEKPCILDLRVKLDEAFESSMEFVKKITDLMERSTKEDIQWTAKVKKETASRIKPKRAQELINIKALDFNKRAKKLRILTLSLKAASEDFFNRLEEIIHFQINTKASTIDEIKRGIIVFSKSDLSVYKARDQYIAVINAISNLPEPSIDFKLQKRNLILQFEQLNAVLGLWLDRSALLRSQFNFEEGGIGEKDAVQ